MASEDYGKYRAFLNESLLLWKVIIKSLWRKLTHQYHFQEFYERKNNKQLQPKNLINNPLTKEFLLYQYFNTEKILGMLMSFIFKLHYFYKNQEILSRRWLFLTF